VQLTRSIFGICLLDYNYHRISGSLGKLPMQRWAKIEQKTSHWGHVIEQFNLRRKPVTSSN
jgi:hypothetical protein